MGGRAGLGRVGPPGPGSAAMQTVRGGWQQHFAFPRSPPGPSRQAALLASLLSEVGVPPAASTPPPTAMLPRRRSSGLPRGDVLEKRRVCVATQLAGDPAHPRLSKEVPAANASCSQGSTCVGRSAWRSSLCMGRRAAQRPFAGNQGPETGPFAWGVWLQARLWSRAPIVPVALRTQGRPRGSGPASRRAGRRHQGGPALRSPAGGAASGFRLVSQCAGILTSPWNPR